jgi:phospholipid/cholesterol/gamma-HCH transport system substrate-binding protein
VDAAEQEGYLMNREFKFRHANEIAGVFVIGAAVLFVLGIVFAGRSQGWFEPRFTLNVVFDTMEGSFGLQEGAPVMVRNTQAGRVGPVLPTADGLMGTTLVLKDRFRPFITTDSVAKIKKKFGVAGDSYVDIARGQGKIIVDEAYIECVKDEELLETAQKMLADVQTNIMPILAKAEAIITSVASILDQVDTGKGVAGAAIGDSRMRDDVTAMVAHMESIARSAGNTIGTVDTLMSNEVAKVLANVGVLSDQTVDLMRENVPILAGETVKVQGELTRTLAETRRLIEGLQRHWLLRKYMVHDPDRLPLVSGVPGWLSDSGRAMALREALDDARVADAPAQIRLAAYNLAVEALSANKIDQAEERLQEIRFAVRLMGEEPAPHEQLLAAELFRRAGDFEQAVKTAESVLKMTRGRHERALHAEAWLLLTAVYTESGNATAARMALQESKRAVERVGSESPLIAAACSGVEAGVAVLDGDLAAAAAAYAKQSGLLRDTGNHAGMTAAQQRAAELYATLGMSNSSATFYLRAASGLLARGLDKEAEALLALAQVQAQNSGDGLLGARIAGLAKSIE